jgi:hypothetical protein
MYLKPLVVVTRQIVLLFHLEIGFANAKIQDSTRYALRTIKPLLMQHSHLQEVLYVKMCTITSPPAWLPTIALEVSM